METIKCYDETTSQTISKCLSSSDASSVSSSSSNSSKEMRILCGVVFFSFGLQVMLTLPLLLPLIRHLYTESGDLNYFNDNSGTLMVTVSGAWYLMNAIFAPFWGFVADRYGRRPVLLISLLGSMTSMLIIVFSTSYQHLLMARLLSGVLDSTPFICKTTLGDLCAKMNAKKRSAEFSKMMIWLAVSLAISPYLGSVLHSLSRRLFPSNPSLLPFGFAALFFFFVFVLCLQRFEETLKRRSEIDIFVESPNSSRFSKLLPSALAIALYAFMAMMLTGSEQLVALLTETGRDEQGLGLDSTSVSVFFSIQGAFFVLSQLALLPAFRSLPPRLRVPIVGLRVGLLLLIVIIPAGFTPSLMTSVELSSIAMPLIMCCRIAVVSIALTSAVLNIDESCTPEAKGIVNGAAQSLSSLLRFIGIQVAGEMFDVGTRLNFLFLPYLVFGLGILLTFIVSFLRYPSKNIAPNDKSISGAV